MMITWRKNDVYDGFFVAEALEFDLVHRGDSEYDDMKCVSEEHNERAIVLFSFKSIDNVKLSIKLFDPNEKVVNPPALTRRKRAQPGIARARTPTGPFIHGGGMFRRAFSASVGLLTSPSSDFPLSRLTTSGTARDAATRILELASASLTVIEATAACPEGKPVLPVFPPSPVVSTGGAPAPPK